MKKNFPRLMLTALSSGSGKTYITCGLLTLFARKGLDVRSFKCGPDYIDPMFHRAVLQVPSKNLDPYFTDRNTTRELFTGSASDEISLIEGVMGYFDGLGGTRIRGSSFELATMLETPVVLIVDCKGVGRTVCAQIKGMLDYESEHLGKNRMDCTSDHPGKDVMECTSDHLIKGVILNRMSATLFPAMKEQIELELPVKVLGYLPEQKDFHLDSRHLGLKMPEEIEDLREKLDHLADTLESTIDLEAFLMLAKQAPAMECKSETDNQRQIQRQGQIRKQKKPSCRIGVAKDSAFCFYYEDNIRLLEENGAEILYFSPLQDQTLPDVDGILIGGGYPELYAKELSQNEEMKKAIFQAAESGMPMLAECGGFMYLQKSLKDKQEHVWEMVDVLPGECYDTGRLGRFGYVELAFPDGKKIKAHEFHYYDSTENGDYAHAEKPVGNRFWECMVKYKGILAGFPHLYYPSCPEFGADFVEQCVRWKNRNAL